MEFSPGREEASDGLDSRCKGPFLRSAGVGLRDGRWPQTVAADGITVTFLVECIAKTLQTKRIPLHLALIAASTYCTMSRAAANAVAFVDAPIP